MIKSVKSGIKWLKVELFYLCLLKEKPVCRVRQKDNHYVYDFLH
jgi:hypothetical protein